MFAGRTFQAALIISIFTHGLILFRYSRLNLSLKNKKEENLEITYLLKKEEDKLTQAPKSNPVFKKEPLRELPRKISAAKKIPPPFIDIDNRYVSNEKEQILPTRIFAKPIFIKPEIMAIKGKVVLSSADADKINSPAYIVHYQAVRDKIKHVLDQSYFGTETGEVQLSFILSREGYLKEARIGKDRSSQSPYLQEVVLKSVRAASPFPGFPRDLDFLELSYNVTVSFEAQ